jgi:hypothetical protein
MKKYYVSIFTIEGERFGWIYDSSVDAISDIIRVVDAHKRCAFEHCFYRCEYNQMNPLSVKEVKSFGQVRWFDKATDLIQLLITWNEHLNQYYDDYWEPEWSHDKYGNEGC